MSANVIDVSNMLLKYENNAVYTVIADKDNEPWFNGKDCANFFGYVNFKKALKNNVSVENKNKLKYIVSAYKLLYKNVQGNSIYINENGFFELLSKSNKPGAKEIQKWMYTEVLPQLRKNGQYEIEKRMRDKLIEVNDQVDKLRKKNAEIKNRNKALENNQKNLKYPEGGSIYIMRPSVISDKKVNKIGKSKKNLKNRFSVYNTTVPDNIDEKIYIPVEDPDGTELCLKGLLHKYQYRKKKEFFKCTVKEILKNLDICVFTTEGKHISIFKKKLSRETSDSIENITVDVENDNEEELFEFEDEMEDDDDEMESDSDDEIEQRGGEIDYEFEYYKYLRKNLELMLLLHKEKRRF